MKSFLGKTFLGIVRMTFLDRDGREDPQDLGQRHAEGPRGGSAGRHSSGLIAKKLKCQFWGARTSAHQGRRISSRLA